MGENSFLVPEALEQCGAKLALVLGSGLGPFADSLPHDAIIPFTDINGLPASKVPGHAGRFVVARLGTTPVLIAQGRVHLYEGWSARDASASVRLFHQIGIQTVILTNAAGTLNKAHPPGEWMMLTDHLNLTGQSPLHGGPNFFDMSEVYDKKLRDLCASTAAETGMPLHQGVYAALPGPQYETPAEIRMLQTLGADAVGMSTVPEAIQARALGLRVAAFSCLTNWGAGLSGDTLNHTEVTETGRHAADTLARLFHAVVPKMEQDRNDA